MSGPEAAKETKYVCSKCGGDRVQHTMWVRTNTGEVIDDYGTFNFPGRVFCEDCEEDEVKLVEKEV